MSFFTSLLVALFCMSIVFAVLAILLAIIRLFTTALGFFTGRKKHKRSGLDNLAEHHAVAVNPVQATAAAVPTAAAGNTVIVEQPVKKAVTGEIKLNNVDEKTAAMLMAIVSHESGIPLANLIFKSVRLLDNDAAATV